MLLESWIVDVGCRDPQIRSALLPPRNHNGQVQTGKPRLTWYIFFKRFRHSRAAPPAARRRSSFVRRVDARIAQPFDETDETRSRIDHHNPKRRNNWIFLETDYMSEVSRRRTLLFSSLPLCLPPSSPCVFGELIYDGISF